MTSPKPTPNNKSLLLKYAGLTGQILVSLGIAVFAGYKIDGWLNFTAPILVLVLPILVIVGLIYRVIKDTSKKDNV